MISPISSRRWCLALFAVLSLLSMPALAQTNVAGITIQNGPSEAAQAWTKAVEAGDIGAIARMYGPHTVLYGVDSAVTRGEGAIVADYVKMFERYKVKVAFRDAAWVRSGPVLSSWGQFTLTLTPRAGGEPVRTDGRFSDVAVWNDGAWQYLVDHASVPAR